MKTTKKYFILLLYFILIRFFTVNNSTAQELIFPDHPLVISYTSSEYFASQQNWAITETQEGFMLFGNSEGLLLYYGKGWILHETDRSPGNLFSASDGTVFATLSSDIGIVDFSLPLEFEFRSLLPTLTEDEVQFLDTYEILEIGNHVYFITDNGVFVYNGTKLSYVSNVYPIVINTNKEAWLQDFDGYLFQHTNPENRFKNPLPPLYFSLNNPDGTVEAISYEADTFTIDFDNLDVAYNSYIDDRFLKIAGDDGLFRVFYNDDSHLLFTSTNLGLLITDQHGYLIKNYNELNGLPDNTVIAAYLDSHSNIWLAGNYGIHQLVTSSNTSVITHSLGITGIIWGFKAHGDNYYVTTSDGLFFHPRGTDFRKFQKIDSDYNLSYSDLYSLRSPASNEYELFIVGFDGVYTLNSNNQVEEIINEIFSWIFELPHFPNMLWGVDFYNRLIAINYNNGNWSVDVANNYYFSDYISGISTNEFGALFTFYDKGAIFAHISNDESDFKTQNKLVDRITDIEGFTIELFNVEVQTDTAAINSQSGLRSPTVGFFNNKKLIYSDDGIFRLDTERLPSHLLLKRWETVGIDQSEWIYWSMIRTTEGYIWFSRSRNRTPQLGAINLSDLNLRINQPFYFLNTWEVNELVYDADNDLIFAISPTKILVRDSSDIYENSIITPKLHLLSFRDQHNNSITNPSEITENPVFLSSGTNNLQVEVAGNTLHNSTSLKYSFFLEGYDASFTPWSESNSREFANLKPGHYTLKARMLLADGRVIEQTFLSFFINTPVYLSLGAFALYISLLILFIYGLVWYRSKKLREQNQKLEELVQERLVSLTALMNELLQQKNELRRQIELKKQLTKIAAHDLKNPLTAIKGYSFLINNEDDIEEIHQSAETINQLAEKMNDIINKISTNEKYSSLELRFEDVHIKETIDRLLKQYSIFLEEKQQSVSVLCDDMPAIEGDKLRISEIFENLLSNAIKYSPSGSEIEIKIDFNSTTGFIVTTITDEGPGFSDDDRELAFNEYKTLSAQPTGTEDSTGLGLFIVRKLVEAHNGTVKILDRSKDKSGASIEVSLPIKSTSSE